MTAPRVQVLRGVNATAADLGTVRARVARDLVIDPALVRDATDDGYRTGYNAGFTAGLEDAGTAIDTREQQRRAELRTVMDSLDTAVDALDDHHADIIADIERRLIEIAYAIAVELVGHELAATTHPGRDAIERCLRLAPRDGTVVAYLHPDDVATAGIDTDAVGRPLRIVADASLASGDAIVDVGPTRIDGRIEPALERIREALGR